MIFEHQQVGEKSRGEGGRKVFIRRGVNFEVGTAGRNPLSPLQVPLER